MTAVERLENTVLVDSEVFVPADASKARPSRRLTFSFSLMLVASGDVPTYLPCKCSQPEPDLYESSPFVPHGGTYRRGVCLSHSFPPDACRWQGKCRQQQDDEVSTDDEPVARRATWRTSAAWQVLTCWSGTVDILVGAGLNFSLPLLSSS